MSRAIGRTTNDQRPTTKDGSHNDRLVLRLSSLVEGRRGEIVFALLAGLLAVVLIGIGFGQAAPPVLDVGVRDARFVAGFNEPETFLGPPVRWTAGDATIALPRQAEGAATLLDLRMLNSRPADRPDPHVALSVDDRLLATFDVPRTIEGMRIYHALVPGDARFDWATRVGLASDTIALPNDPRPLGVIVDQAAVRPLQRALAPLWLIAWSAALGALGYALPRSAGLGRAAAAAVTLILAASIALGVAGRPLEVLPFVHRIAALLAIGALGIWLARTLAPPLPTTDHRPRTAEEEASSRWSVVGGRWSLRGSDLPLYLAIASWLGPLFQLVMTADGATSVTPPVVTMWIGGIMALGLLLVVGGWYALRGRALPSEQRSAIVGRLALAIFVLGGLAHLGYMVWFAFQRTATDFWIFFRGARDWSRGLPLYDLSALADNFYGHVFKVPPFFAMLLLPFVSQDGLQVLFYFRILDTILIGATALVWLRMWRVRIVSMASLGLLVLLNFRPFADAMTGGQTDLILLLVLTLALWALQRERDVLAGGLLAFGVMLKLYPIVLLAFFVLKRRWRGLAGFALGMLIANGLAVAVMGWEPHRTYVTQVLLFSAGPTAWVENQAIAGFLARFIAPATEAVVVQSQGAKLLANAIAGAIGLLMCYLTLRPVKPTTTTYALQYSQFLLLMLLAAPAAWMHYETLLFLPFAALLLHMRDRAVSLARTAALALSFGLIGYGNQWSYYDGTVMGVLTIAGMSYKLYGMLLLGGIIATTLWEEWALSGEPRLREMAVELWRRLISNRHMPTLPGVHRMDRGDTSRP